LRAARTRASTSSKSGWRCAACSRSPERWPLELYWDAARQENEIGRAQGVTAAFNGIVRQLRRAGCYEQVTEL